MLCRSGYVFLYFSTIIFLFQLPLCASSKPFIGQDEQRKKYYNEMSATHLKANPYEHLSTGRNRTTWKSRFFCFCCFSWWCVSAASFIFRLLFIIFWQSNQNFVCFCFSYETTTRQREELQCIHIWKKNNIIIVNAIFFLPLLLSNRRRSNQIAYCRHHCICKSNEYTSLLLSKNNAIHSHIKYAGFLFWHAFPIWINKFLF